MVLSYGFQKWLETIISLMGDHQLECTSNLVQSKKKLMKLMIVQSLYKNNNVTKIEC
jgi:hypothetical protein